MKRILWFLFRTGPSILFVYAVYCGWEYAVPATLLYIFIRLEAERYMDRQRLHIINEIMSMLHQIAVRKSFNEGDEEEEE